MNPWQRVQVGNKYGPKIALEKFNVTTFVDYGNYGKEKMPQPT